MKKNLWRSAVLFASPRGEVASRSDDGEGIHASQLNIVPVSSNFPVPWGTTQISRGTRTKCRKTRAKRRDFAIAVSLSLKQLRHFYGSRHSFPKIFMFSLRYINCSCELLPVLLASPRGEVASRSDDGEGTA